MDARGSHDSSHLVSGGGNRIVYLWDVTSKHPVKMLRGHSGQVNCVCFNQESSMIASGSLDGSVRLWDTKSNSRDSVQILADAKDSITSLCISDHEIITSSLDSKVRRYDLRRGLLDVDDVGASVTHVSLSKDGQCLLTACLHSPVKLLDKDTGEILNFYAGHAHKKYKLEAYFVKNDSHVICGSEDSNLYFWDLIKGTVKTTVAHEGHRVVHSLNVHPSQNEILTAAEGTVYLWTTEEE
ncbi:WD repeat domain-containing protein 83-like protein [Leptotrombidium deliense]|uniref:WD repeat domain-containing protein 83 n=1 Tax=Leptotrombidium deliense TaxID=299467 RepID=A0A443SFF3_9ACAR|nr:WD repeat domain-containing protein 83-like protein [Leptotrombidium deliense]